MLSIRCFVHVIEFASRVGDTSSFNHLAAVEDVVIPSVAVDLQDAGKAVQKLLGPLLTAIGLEVKHHGLALAPGAAAIRPQIAGGSATRTWREHRHGGLIGL